LIVSDYPEEPDQPLYDDVKDEEVEIVQPTYDDIEGATEGYAEEEAIYDDAVNASGEADGGEVRQIWTVEWRSHFVVRTLRDCIHI